MRDQCSTAELLAAIEEAQHEISAGTVTLRFDYG